MRKKQILALVLVAAIIFGIIVYLLLSGNDKNKLLKEVVLTNGVTYEELSFSANGLNPGDSCNYTLKLTAKNTGIYGIDLTFIEKKAGGLRDFIFVRVERDNAVNEYSLNELFNGLTIGFNIEISRKIPTRIRIIFEMPQEVGNEAQGAESYFIVNLTAERV